jgi:hypothetical protein
MIHTNRYSAKCHCGLKVVAEFGNMRTLCGAPTVDMYGQAVTCTARLKWREIIASLSGHKCGGRCTSAIGPVCDCECGGHRHGIDLMGLGD